METIEHEITFDSQDHDIYKWSEIHQFLLDNGEKEYPLFQFIYYYKDDMRHPGMEEFPFGISYFLPSSSTEGDEMFHDQFTDIEKEYSVSKEDDQIYVGFKHLAEVYSFVDQNLEEIKGFTCGIDINS